MRRVFVPLFLLISISIYLFHKLNIPLNIVLPTTLSIFIISILSINIIKLNLSYTLIIISIALLFGVHFQNEKIIFHNTSNTELPQNYYITVFGKIIDFPEFRTDTTILYINTNRVEYKKNNSKHSLNIRVSVVGKVKNISKGDRIRINIKISERNISKNFYKNPIDNYFLSNKIHLSASCKSRQMINVLEKNDFWIIIQKLRSKIKKILDKKYSGHCRDNNNKKAFIKAILLGDRGDITANLKESLLNTGIYHIFAISGAHIGIISILMVYLLKLLKFSKKKRYYISAFSIIFYLIISGGHVATQRAVIMSLIIMLSKIIYQKADIYNIIAFSGILILLINPLDILDPGFILTFTLSTGITAGRNMFLPLIKKIPNFTGELISASLSASIISLPLSLYFFKRYSLISFMSSILLIPISTIIIGLSFILFPFSIISDYFSNLLLYLLDPFLSLFFMLIDNVLNNIDGTIYRASPPLLMTVIFLVIFIYISIYNFKRIHIKYFLLLCMSIMIIFFISPDVKYIPENLEVYYIDVGQGDSELILFPDGKTLLIDGGGTYYSSFRVGQNILLPFLLQKKTKVDWVAISHTHPDHVRGVIEILNILKPDELWLSQKAIRDNLYLELLKTKSQLIKIRYIDSKFIRTGKNYKIRCIFPESVIKKKYATNNNSQVLKISNERHSFLFTGDIEKETEKFLSETNPGSLRAQVIKVPHHGSKTSSTKVFLNLVRPEIAVFSSKANNKFGFPHSSVIKNYQKIKTKMLFTAISGGIKITSTKKGLVIKRSKTKSN